MAVTCGLPLNGAMASAINALDDVHGGAGQQCMELLQAIDGGAGDSDGDAGRSRPALDRFIAANGKIIPGFGHRWHGVDPRAVRLLQLVARGAGAPARSAAASRRIGVRDRAAAAARARASRSR